MRVNRTDLADELFEIHTDKSGVRTEDLSASPLRASLLEITNQEAAKRLGKEIGQYITLELGEIWAYREERFRDIVQTVSDCIKRLLPPMAENILVVGIGNRHITPDSIGPGSIEHVMVTRHLIQDLPDIFGHFNPVSALSPGVLGLTGVETGEIVLGLCDRLKPGAVIAVDALSSRKLNRLLRTIQFSDSGISPGSGVGNNRFPLSLKTLGIPCIAIGVPTVIDAGTLTNDVLEDSGCASEKAEIISERFSSLMVTPRDIDAEASALCKILGYGINLALQPGLGIEDITAFLG